MEHVLHLCNENMYLMYLLQLNCSLALFLQKAYCALSLHENPSGLVSLSFTVVKHRKKCIAGKTLPGVFLSEARGASGSK